MFLTNYILGDLIAFVYSLRCYIYGIPTWDENGSCGRSLPANARFCPDCGCESLFFKEEMLEPWHVESQKLKTTIDEEIPF